MNKFNRFWWRLDGLTRYFIIQCVIYVFMVLVLSLTLVVPVFGFVGVVQSIPHGFNVSVHVRQLQGNLSLPTFDNCNRIDGSNLDWFCDIHDSPGFNLTMRTDSAALDYGFDRYYQLNIHYSTYVLNDWQFNPVIRDQGSNFVVLGNVPQDNGGCVNTISRVQYVNVTEIVYRDRIVNVEYNQTVYSFVNVSWENTTLIDDLNDSLYLCEVNLSHKGYELVDMQNQRNFRNNLLLLAFAIIFGLSFWIYDLKKVKK